MASTIQLKRGSGAPTSGDLATGELGLDLTNNRIYSSTDGSDVVLMGFNPATTTFTGTVKLHGYSPAVDYDFDGTGTVTSSDTTAYTNFSLGLNTGVDISSYSGLEPSWDAIAGNTYTDQKFRIMAVSGNSTDSARVAVGLSKLGYGDSVLIGNVIKDGSSTKIHTGISIDGPLMYLMSNNFPIGLDGRLVPTLDNQFDLGTSSYRFDDIYATNGTIQTSDANEKQDIEALSVAEQLVAARCKNLVRKFKWKSSVAEKGAEARTHFGVIAQDVKAAFEAEGLNASDYGLFIESTWTDDDGVEHTRLGVRYTELFAFIISAL